MRNTLHVNEEGPERRIKGTKFSKGWRGGIWSTDRGGKVWASDKRTVSYNTTLKHLSCFS